MPKQLIPEEEKIKGGGKTMKPILIVEDEAIMRESLQDWLTDGGYQVETVKDGEEALQTIAEQDFSVAILDLKLPGKDGIEVLREAKAKKPQLTGIIITAYPSVETAVEAVKVGAIDYLCKPIDLNQLEKLIQDILGPVQVEIRPKAITEEALAKPVAVEEAKAEEVIAIAPDEVPVHLKQGKAHFQAGRYQEALKEFEAILGVTPGSIEARAWVRKTKEALMPPKVEGVAEETKPKYCLWMKIGLISHRLCTFDYDCQGCEFDQDVRERLAAGDPKVVEALRRELELPGNQRLCRYALKGQVSYRLCSRLFQCDTCEFAQMMDYVVEQKLAGRKEAIDKKEQSWWWSYWS
jgi:DNA-binding response OmpR family regulator